jgi:ABC-type sugar transport system ATPase subunit
MVAGDQSLTISNDMTRESGVVAIRPEHFVVANGSSLNRLRVEIVQFTYLGARTYLHVSLQNLKMVVDLPSTETKGLMIGAPLELTVDPKFVRFLP